VAFGGGVSGGEAIVLAVLPYASISLVGYLFCCESYNGGTRPQAVYLSCKLGCF
jgi:hypothetical protein